MNKDKFKLEGCFTAVPTPFKDGAVDYAALERIIGFQTDNGVSGLVPCGSTGEAATLCEEEYLKVIETTVKCAGGRVPVMPGLGSNNTAAAVKLAEKVAALGPDAVLLTVPSYNKPQQRGITAHFSAVIDAAFSGLPVVLYNIPGRTGVNMLPATVKEISERYPNVAGVKEASGNVQQACDIIRMCGKEFSVMSGEDNLILPLMACGARGVVSVVANVMPAVTQALCDTMLGKVVPIEEDRPDGAILSARRDFYQTAEITSLLFCETNPVPVKYAMSLMGLCSPEVRLPLTPLSPEKRGAVASEMKKLGLVK